MLLIIIYLRFSFCVKGDVEGFVIWFCIWCMFIKFLLIKSCMLIFLWSGGSLLVMCCKWGWVWVIFGVGIFIILFGMLLYFIMGGSLW